MTGMAPHRLQKNYLVSIIIQDCRAIFSVPRFEYRGRRRRTSTRENVWLPLVRLCSFIFTGKYTLSEFFVRRTRFLKWTVYVNPKNRRIRRCYPISPMMSESRFHRHVARFIGIRSSLVPPSSPCPLALEYCTSSSLSSMIAHFAG